MRWAAVVDLLFPSACVECDAVGPGLCGECFPPLPPVRFALEGLRCVALGEYEGVLRRAILALKGGRRDVGDALGALLGAAVEPMQVDMLVPVPTTVARRRERGFDQGELLARAASRRAELPVAALLRQSAGDRQRGRSRTERLAAVGRFVCMPASILAGARVLLVDDVATTGATLRDCAETLRGAGLRVNGAAVVARARDERVATNAKESELHAEGRLERSRAR
jgi:ComF family protein